MKRVVTFLKSARAVLPVLLIAGAAVAAQAQGARGKLEIDSLDRLAPRAAETVNVNMDERLLRIVPGVLSKTDPDEKKAGELIVGLKGVYVKRFEFDAEGAYTEADVASVRAQLRAPGWTRIVEVRSRREGSKNVEVYLLTDGSRIEAMTVISAEPKELTVVNILGSVDLDKLRDLEGQFGIPELEIERDEDKSGKKTTVTKKP